MLVVFVSVVFGVVLSLVSGFYGRDVSGGLGVSVVGYGLPLSWYTTSWVVYPTSPVVSSYSLQSFILDTAFWTIITLATILTAVRACSPRG